MANNSGARVAIVGASGIGKHHAAWWTLEGANVCAVAGSTKASAERAADGLKRSLGFRALAFADVAAMIETAKPDIVDVCSPAELHAEHVAVALGRGCHVLCEKPFVVLEDETSSATMKAATDLVSLAHTRGLRLSVCTQYSAFARILAEILGSEFHAEPLRYFKGHLQAPARDRLPLPGRVWTDLSPHPLSVLLHFVDASSIDWDSLGVHFEGYGARALFSARNADGNPVECDIVTRNTIESPFHVRYFQLNDHPVNLLPAQDESGVYSARIETSERMRQEPDMMRLLIRDFLAGTPTVRPDAALRNLDAMLRILDAASGQINLQSLRRPQ